MQRWRDAAPDVLKGRAKAEVEMACVPGQAEVLEWWKSESGVALEGRYDAHSAIDIASSRGHLAVLQWWKDTGLPVRYSDYAMGNARQRPGIAVFGSCHGTRQLQEPPRRALQWSKDSGLQVRYSCTALDLASSGGVVAVLQWWKDSGLQLQYSANAINLLERQWWKDSGLDPKYSQSVLFRANEAVRQWWKTSGWEN
ncbi:hypothetical protein DFJ73DRAFT_766204 [Zopfochytrium polystomum]|nr:hypothetical protein DFJ73DRAFT_766204 [Zopfochytrium polystomum]